MGEPASQADMGTGSEDAINIEDLPSINKSVIYNCADTLPSFLPYHRLFFRPCHRDEDGDEQRRLRMFDLSQPYSVVRLMPTSAFFPRGAMPRMLQARHPGVVMNIIALTVSLLHVPRVVII